MDCYRIRLAVTVLLAAFFVPVHAGIVHKWVDSDGITHYSDEPPDTLSAAVTTIELPETEAVSSKREDQYYSIANQWQRMHQERLEIEKARPQQVRQRIDQNGSSPEIVIIERPGENKSVIVYSQRGHRGWRPGHKKLKRHHRHSRYKTAVPGRSIPRNWLAQQNRGGFYRP